MDGEGEADSVSDSGTEEPIISRLAKMLVQTPYTAPEKKAKGKAKGVRSGPRRKGSSDATSEDKTRSLIRIQRIYNF